MKYIFYISKSFVILHLFKDLSLHIELHEIENLIDMNIQELKTFSSCNLASW